VPRGNNNNLIPGNERSHREATENGRKGGIASGEARRAKRDRRIRLEHLVATVIDKNLLPGDIKHLNGTADLETIIDLALVKKCQSGDIRALELYYKLRSRDPLVSARVREVDIKAQELDLREKEQKSDSDNALIDDWLDGIADD